MSRVLLLVAGLAGCGRVGFDALAIDPGGDADAGEDADASDAPTACTQFGPWQPPVPVTELNTVDGDADATFANNGLTVYFTRYGNPGQIWTATRASMAAPFANAAILDDLNLGTNSQGNSAITQDALEIYYGIGALYRCTRTSTALVFGAESPGIDASAAFFSAEAAALSNSELDMYFDATAQSTGRIDIFRVHRNARTDAFMGANAVALGTPEDSRYPSVSLDGLELVYARPSAATGTDLWSVTRPSTAVEFDFSTETRLDVLDTALDDQDAALTSDRTQMMFDSLRPGGDGSYDLYLSQRECMN